MGNKKMRPVYNRGKQEKEFLNQVQKEQKVRTFLMTNFEDRQYIKNEDTVNFAVLKMLVYVFSENQKNYVKLRFSEALKQLMAVNMFQNSKLLGHIKSGNFSGAFSEISRVLKREYSRVFFDYYSIVYSTLDILLEYTNFEEYIGNNTDYIDFFEDFCFYAFTLVLEQVVWNAKIDYEKGKEVNDEYVKEYLDYFEKEKERMRDFKIENTWLISSFSTNEVRDTFVNIINLYMSEWFHNTENKGVSHIDIPFNKLTVKGKEKEWNFFKDCISKGRPNDSKVEDADMDLYARMSDIIVLNYFSISTDAVNYIIFDLTKLIMSDRLNSYNEEVKKISEQSKSLINTNRQLTKTSSKLEKELENKNAEITRLTEELAKKEEVKQNNEELERLREVVSEFDGIKANLEAELSKVQSKIEWQEGKIGELTSKLDFYSTLEDDIASLQNEKSALISSIEKIEELEEEEEEVYDEKYKAIKDLSILFVGGKNNMLSKFKRYFPNSEFIDIDDGFNFNLSGRFDFAVVFTRVVSHAQCGRLSSQMPKERIFNVNTCNLKLMVDEIYRLFKIKDN